ncbi:toxin-antitoxin system, antitoxin component [Brevundimonas pondensis]|uniref:Toxin-antitoxin system, antitoxin component n=1 Tax=Brevundimonas pondensis TaxID=2774189 RepID=A0ABX7SJ03_9CAUL|nr:toxin-antitoxin system, antitoxin component [Brevundimonas pondensis]QTC86416.1 toxin-antitoxin system, antitoxin component [Brevundimonas pondensis]
MAKYEPLERYLRRQKAAEVELSFRDIERMVGGLLPKASADLKWWRVEDGPTAPPQQRAFAAAGYVAQPELRAERVRFVRSAIPKPSPAVSAD